MDNPGEIDCTDLIAYAPAKVWQALTQPTMIARWWAPGNIAPTLGHEFEMDMGAWGKRVCVVTMVKPDHTLEYSFGGFSSICWTLAAEGEGTRLRLRHTGFDMSTEQGRMAHAGMGTGWPKILKRIAPAISIAERELVLERVFKAPPNLVYRAWTEPEMLKKWFAPKPWGVSRVENEVRSGGLTLIVMRDPEGNEYPNPGVYLEVVPDEKLVFTNAFVRAWEPSEKPFFVATITFDNLGNGQTRYRAVVQHWTAADREMHEQMGFHSGWGQCADQLRALIEQ